MMSRQDAIWPRKLTGKISQLPLPDKSARTRAEKLPAGNPGRDVIELDAEDTRGENER